MRAEWQEAKEKARAWRLYHKQEKERNPKRWAPIHGKGGSANLQGKVFEITAKDAVHQYAETVKAIVDYVGQEYTHGGDIHNMIENLAD